MAVLQSLLNPPGCYEILLSGRRCSDPPGGCSLGSEGDCGAMPPDGQARHRCIPPLAVHDGVPHSHTGRGGLALIHMAQNHPGCHRACILAASLLHHAAVTPWQDQAPELDLDRRGEYGWCHCSSPPQVATRTAAERGHPISRQFDHVHIPIGHGCHSTT